VLSTTLAGGQNEWNLLESFDLSAIGDEMPWIHFELSDGSLTSHATFPVTPAPTPLQAGDADQDLDFDQFDLIRAQTAAKYLDSRRSVCST
jgi:hypothetical protein